MPILIKNARILTMDDAFTEHQNADILIEGSKITAIGPNLEINQNQDDVRIIDGSGKLAMPGLVNGHIHSPGNFMKGALDNLPLEIFMLYEVPPLSDTPPSFRTTYVRTMLSNIEMLKLGVTSVHDDAYHIPVPTPDSMDGIMKAYVDSGLRAVVTLDQANVIEYDKYPFLYDLLPEDLRKSMADAPRMTTPQLLDCYKYQIDKWHNADNGRVRSGVSISAPQRVTQDYFGALSDLSKQLDVPFDVHVLETKLQRVLGETKYGKSLIKYIHDLGYLDERMMIIHAIWVDDEDVALMQEAKVSIAHNPICNLRLGSGVMTWRRMHDHGIPICLGSDEGCSDDTANMWAVGKAAGLIHSITETDYSLWPKAKEVVRALTRGGARAMRNEGKVGALIPGHEADIILLDLNTITFTPLNDIYRQLVYCENGSSVVMSIIAGKVVLENGKVLTVDEEAIKAEVRELTATVQQELAETAKSAALLEPYYRAMYEKSVAMDVGMNRWVGNR